MPPECKTCVKHYFFSNSANMASFRKIGFWWGRWDLNPGSPTPQAGILNQSSQQTSMKSLSITTNTRSLEAIRRPQLNEPYAEQINKTIDLAISNGKAFNTVNLFRQRLTELAKIPNLNLMQPDEVKLAIGFSKLSNASKQCFALSYEWFCKANELKWEKPSYKWIQGTPLIPTTDQVNKIISATTTKLATIFKLMAKVGVEGEELHQAHRSHFDPSQKLITIKGLKGHGTANCKLEYELAEMLKEYFKKYTKDYPFPQTKVMSQMWRRARKQASENHNDKMLLNIPMKNLRNYSGAQFYYRFPDPTDVMRHMRHKRMETTMHYIRAIVLDAEVRYHVKTATTPEQMLDLASKGYEKFDEMNGIHGYRKRK
jgi:hypothetical protein